MPAHPAASVVGILQATQIQDNALGARFHEAIPFSRDPVVAAEPSHDIARAGKAASRFPPRSEPVSEGDGRLFRDFGRSIYGGKSRGKHVIGTALFAPATVDKAEVDDADGWQIARTGSRP